MESHRFDTIVKTLGSGTSRRRVLRGLLSGAAAAGILARFSVPAAADICKAEGKACKKTSQCCAGWTACQVGTARRIPMPTATRRQEAERSARTSAPATTSRLVASSRSAAKVVSGHASATCRRRGRAAAGKRATAGTLGFAPHRPTALTVRSASTPRTAGRTACYRATPKQLGRPSGTQSAPARAQQPVPRKRHGREPGSSKILRITLIMRIWEMGRNAPCAARGVHWHDCAPAGPVRLKSTKSGRGQRADPARQQGAVRW